MKNLRDQDIVDDIEHGASRADGMLAVIAALTVVGALTIIGVTAVVGAIS